MYYYFFYHFLSFPTFLWIIFINFHLLIFCVKISTDIFWYIRKIKLLRICQNRYFHPGFCWRINFVLWFAFISFFLEGSTYFLVLWIFFFIIFIFIHLWLIKFPISWSLMLLRTLVFQVGKWMECILKYWPSGTKLKWFWPPRKSKHFFSHHLSAWTISWQQVPKPNALRLYLPSGDLGI